MDRDPPNERVRCRHWLCHTESDWHQILSGTSEQGIRDKGPADVESELAQPGEENRNAAKVGWSKVLNDRQWEMLERSCLRDIEKCKREDGEEGMSVLESMRELASVYNNRRRFEEAEKLYGTILEVAERTVGTESLFTVDILDELALNLELQGRVTDAEKAYLRLIKAGKRILQADSARNSSSEGLDDEEIEDLKATIEKAEDAIENIQTLPPDFPLKEITEKYSLMDGLLETHFPLHPTQVKDDEGFQDIETGFGGSPRTVADVLKQASSYIEQREVKKAEQYLHFMMEMHQRVLGSEHADTLAIMETLGSVYEAQGMWVEAEGLYTRLVEAKRKVLGEKDPRTLEIEFKLAGLVLGQGRSGDSWRLSLEFTHKALEAKKSWDDFLKKLPAAFSRIGDTSNDEGEPYSEVARMFDDWTVGLSGAGFHDLGERLRNVLLDIQEDPQSERQQAGTADSSDDYGPHNSVCQWRTEQFHDEECSRYFDCPSHIVERILSDNEEEEAQDDVEKADPEPVKQRSSSGVDTSSEHRQNGATEGLETAIRIAEQAIQVAAGEGRSDVASMTNLGRWLRRRFEQTGDEEDLGQALEWAERAVQRTPEDDQELAKRFSNLSMVYLSLYECKGWVSSLEDAVENSKRAVEAHLNIAPKTPN